MQLESSPTSLYKVENVTHGVGEIGITGVAAAVANAVFNATGKRIRELPVYSADDGH